MILERAKVKVPSRTLLTIQSHRTIGSGMRVRREAVMAVHFDTMVPLARFFFGIDMNNDERKIF
jgi:hypothetical protein